MSLKEYIRKRDFNKTAEPSTTKASRAAKRRFVIQKHDASRLHYDFRLEINGTLKSWAVPKGIPMTKGEKRLAVHVEDHPLSYMDFEGVIPKGQYGGGTVMVWDIGTFTPLSKAPTKELANGKLHFVLEGKKLKGEWYLVQLRKSDQWLLIRGGETVKPVSKRMDDTSALSGQSMKQLSEGKRTWQAKPKASSEGGETFTSKGKTTHPVSAFVEPMKARLVDKPPTGGDWIYEIKFDGFRALALKGGAEAKLMSRTEHDMGGKFPELVQAIEQLDARDCVLDGEIVAMDDKGRSSFQLLQAYELGQERPPLLFYAFDLLRLDGKDLKHLPLHERKAELENLLKGAPDVIRYSASLEGDAEKLLAQAEKLGLEGLIGKDCEGEYEAGHRSGRWIKLKIVREQEFVIGGYTEPGGSRHYFGSLIVGVYDHKKLMCVGKVGTGFNQKLLSTLHEQFQPLVKNKCPFANLPEQSSGRWGQGITTAGMKHCTWLKPQLVCQVKFAEWTRDGRLRQPVFLGIREDKKASEVIREEVS